MGFGIIDRALADIGELRGGTHAEDFSAESVSTDELNNAGDIHIYSSEGALIRRFDPSSSSAPIQDALDLCHANGGGEVEVSPGAYDSLGNFKPYTDTSLHFRGGYDETVINVTETGADGLVFDRDRVDDISITGGFRLQGPGDDATTGHAIHHKSGSVVDIHMGPVWVQDWHGAGFYVNPNAENHFENRYDWFRFDKVDAGDTDAVFNIRANGPGNSVGTLVMYPSATSSGSNSTGITTGFVTARWTFDTVNIGGSCGMAATDPGGAFTIRRMNYEPSAHATDPSQVILFRGSGNSRVDALELYQADTEEVGDVYQLFDSPENKHMGPVWNINGMSVANSIVNVNETPPGPSRFEGTVSETRNTTGAALSEPNTVYCYDGFVS